MSDTDDARVEQGGDAPRCPVCKTRGGERPNRNVDYPFKCETPDCRVYSYRGER